MGTYADVGKKPPFRISIGTISIRTEIIRSSLRIDVRGYKKVLVLNITENHSY